LSHYTPWRRLGGEEVQLLLILDLGTRCGWVVSITPRPRFSPGEMTRGTHCTGGWVGPRAGLDKEAIGQILCPCRGSNPDRPVVQPVVRHYTAWANPAHRNIVYMDCLRKYEYKEEQFRSMTLYQFRNFKFVSTRNELEDHWSVQGTENTFGKYRRRGSLSHAFPFMYICCTVCVSGGELEGRFVSLT
jgi:hypothetical protein